jgi:uncharacterized membrane protein
VKDRDLLMDWLPVSLGALAFAGLAHLISIFALPYLSTASAWSRLSNAIQTNRFVVLERGSAGETLLPYEDPRTFVGACVYDLGAGPVRVQADFTGDGLLVVSFHDRQGATFYGLNDRGGLRGKLDALIVTGAQLEAIETAAPDDQPVQELRLLSPTSSGYVIARSVILDSTDVESARQRLALLTCAQQRTPER